MTKGDSASAAKLTGALRAARGIREQLGDDDTKVELKITGGGDRDHSGDGITAVACIFDITSPSRDDANGHFNELAGAGCDCSQPTQLEDGSWFVSCNCPDEE